MCIFKSRLYIPPNWINMPVDNIEDDFKKIQTAHPKFVSYVEREHNKIKTIFFGILIVLVVIWFCSIYFINSFTPWLGILYGIIGTFFLARSALSRTCKLIVRMSVTRYDYSKSIADDLIASKRDATIGISFFIISILIQTIHMYLPTLI